MVNDDLLQRLQESLVDEAAAIEETLQTVGQEALEGSLLGKGTAEERLARIARSFMDDDKSRLEAIAVEAFSELANGNEGEVIEPAEADLDTSKKITFAPAQSNIMSVYACVGDSLVGQ